MRALVYKSTGSWYITKTTDGRVFNARIKGIFKMDTAITSTNPVAVGDEVEMEMENELEHTATITHIYDRRNYINRQSPGHKMQHHIVAANLDQSLLFATIKEPRTSLGFIDRFLVTSEAYQLPAIIVFNKTDLYRKNDLEKLAAWQAVYEAAGYRIIPVSVKEGVGISELALLLKDKTSLLSGHSGVGKSSFINTVFPGMVLRTQEVSNWSGKGLHTTTFAEMFDLPTGGKIIDTPGIREFGLVNIEKQELSHYFPEMRQLINDCQFNNCLHTNEPGCAVKKAVSVGVISEDRYVSYYNILESIEDRNY
ncbi:MAG: ribosome small subunit-dependent GTPase A [Bacteroidota bacterium]